jgi:HK97 family phage portal protein
VNLFGLDVRWSDSPADNLNTRALEQITDIDMAFAEMEADLLGLTETSVPAVFRSRQLLADTVASLPMEQVVGKVVTEDTPPVLVEPNPTQTYHDTLTEIMLSLLDHGNGNAHLWVRSFDKLGNPKSIYVLDPTEVVVTWDRARLYREYSWRDRTMTEGKDLVHIAINRGPGELLGKGPIAAAKATTIQAAKAEEQVAKTLAEDNFTPSLVIKTPEEKTRTEAEEILKTWMTTRDTDGRRKRPAVLGGGSTLEQITFKPVDAQWIEGRNFTVQQIGRLFGLHGFFLLVDSGSSLTYSTTESLFRLFLTATLRPTYLERIEQSFSRLLPSGHKARFNTEEILRADILSRYQAHDIGLGGVGFLTVNEVRALEGLTAIPGGDDLIAVSVQEPGQRVPRAQLNGAAK